MASFINTSLLTQKVFPPKTILVREGNICHEMFFIHKGSIRSWYNSGDQEITLQFFFEGNEVTSLESFLKNIPGVINIETIEACEVSILKKSDLVHLMNTDAKAKEWFYETAVEKLFIHTNRLLSFLKNKPFERYQQLLEEKPEMFQRVPQHYIASYLGITSVSLSRIRNRKRNGS